MSHLLLHILEALAAGGFRVDYGRIAGRSGYVDPQRRSIVLNPDASDEQLLAEIGHDLHILAHPEQYLPARTGRWVDQPGHGLVHAVDEPEDPTPRRLGLIGSARTSSGLRVVG